jgi:hypothetical protein
MRPFLALLTALTLALVAHATQPSGVPSVCWVCPSQDGKGLPIGIAVADDPIFCSYPPTPGGNTDENYCNYDPTFGFLTYDHDSGYCPPSALWTGECNTRRRSIPRGIPRAPKPTSGQAHDVRAKLMKTRAQLGAMKKRGH